MPFFARLDGRYARLLGGYVWGNKEEVIPNVIA